MTSSTTKNYVYAAPSSADGAPSFRKLVAADIPSLAASKITSGTFSTSRLPVSSSQTNSSTKIPTSSLVYSMNQTIANMSTSSLKYEDLHMKNQTSSYSFPRSNYNNIVSCHRIINGTELPAHVGLKTSDNSWSVQFDDQLSTDTYPNVIIRVFYYNFPNGIPSSRNLTITTTGNYNPGSTISNKEYNNITTTSLGFDGSEYLYCRVSGSITYTTSASSTERIITLSNVDTIFNAGSVDKLYTYNNYLGLRLLFDSSDFYVQTIRIGSTAVTSINITACDLTATFY